MSNVPKQQTRSLIFGPDGHCLRNTEGLDFTALVAKTSTCINWETWTWESFQIQKKNSRRSANKGCVVEHYRADLLNLFGTVRLFNYGFILNGCWTKDKGQFQVMWVYTNKRPTRKADGFRMNSAVAKVNPIRDHRSSFAHHLTFSTLSGVSFWWKPRSYLSCVCYFFFL